MAGTISTLGIGSGGVLSSDIIDKLKSADNSSTVKPIQRKQEENNLKIQGLRTIKSALSSLADAASSLSDISLYNNTKATSSSDDVSITTNSNVKEQSFNIKVESLATRSIKQSYKHFSSKDELVGAGTMGLGIDGKNYSIDISDTDTLQDVADKINSQTEGKIEASILNVGGDKPYKLILKSTGTGAKNEITDDGNGINFQNVAGGEAKDAEFRVDGVLIKRDSNKIDDLIEGATITLNKVGTSNIEIKKDSDKIKEKLNDFVDKYNSLNSLIGNLTNYDADKKVGAVLQGNSEIRDIKNRLRDIFDTTFSSDGKMARDFGFDIDKSGKLKFDSSKYDEIAKSSPDSIKDFFTIKDGNPGLFKKFDKELFDLNTKRSGPLKALQTSLEDKSRTLSESLDKAKKRLDAKYKIMEKQFASYDLLIGKIKNSSDYLTQMIDAQNSKK